ncbi:MAG: Ppx/GppA family phosphatase [Phycisphaeraceae bacterium]|nr:Ppx/GppA family phosphatase [Phycisphaeraceae bacterium]
MSELNGTHGLARLAAIDVGTNSIRLMVAEARDDGGYRVLDDEKAVTRLGAGLIETGRMPSDAIVATAEAVARMQRIAEGHGATHLRAVATSAARDASNRDELIRAVHERTGIRLEVISAQEEARMSFRSAAHAFDLSNINAAVSDIGGGSTEVVLSAAGVVDRMHLFRLGAVRLTEKFGVGDRVDNGTIKAMRSEIRETLRDAAGKHPFMPQMLIGTGGTFTALARVSLLLGSDEDASDLLPFNVRGHEMQHAEVRHLIDWFREMSVGERAKVPGMTKDRAEVIVAGATILDCVMEWLGVNTVRVHDGGIRDGLMLTMIEDLGLGGRGAGVDLGRVATARRFAQRCQYEQAHSEHVALLALMLYNELERLGIIDAGGADPHERELLESAAVLHDIGYLINYAKHHKHSYHLIVHSDMPAFTQRELEIVANVARYHRRSGPKKKHPNFAKLRDEDRAIIKRLSAVLRVADGLDRAHKQNVTALRGEREGDVLRLTVDAMVRPHVAVWGATQKSDVFSSVFGVDLEVVWSDESDGECPDAGDGDQAGVFTGTRSPTPSGPD